MCEITYLSSTYVVCVTTSHAPATLPVTLTTARGVARVAIENSGSGSGDDDFLSSYDQPLFLFSYELVVTSVGPLVGSVRGGLTLTVEGWGFHPMLTSVLIGGRPATVTSADDSVVLCIVPPPTVTHTVTFVDEGFSVGKLREVENFSYFTLISPSR